MSISLQKNNVDTASLHSLPDDSSFSAFQVEKSVSEKDLATSNGENEQTVFPLDDHHSLHCKSFKA